MVLIKQSFDLAIIGGGASGLCAAIAAARLFEKENYSGRGIVLIEALPRVGKKILATGNGRCNITNRHLHEDFYFENGSFAMKLIKRADNEAVIEFFSSLGLLIREDSAGRIYPKSNQATSVLDALRFAVQKYNIQVLTDTKVQSIACQKGGFSINSEIYARRVILAAGGQSAKKLGSDGSGFSLLHSLGIKVVPPVPALTGLMLEKSYPASLKGIRAECKVQLYLKKTGSKGRQIPHDMSLLAKGRGEVQFNQRGVSGIPVMQISRFAALNSKKELFLVLDLLPDMSKKDLSAYIHQRIKDFSFLSSTELLSGLMPKALGLICIKAAGISPSAPLAKIRLGEIERLSRVAKEQVFKVEGTQGFDFSQVTAGGGDTGEFDEYTLESKKIKGFYACGEILNVDGMCGGYNLQWAWSSGLVSGAAAAESLI